MKSAFIIHRSYSNPDDDWYAWLARELESIGYTVFRPKFPTPEHQSLQTWLEVFQPYAQHINPETLFIGHGIGCAFILHILEQDIPKVKGLFLVAPFVEPLPHQALRMLEATFTTTPFAWKHIHEQYLSSCVVYASDDPYVSPERAQQVADLLSSTVYTLPSGGHFAGMETFPYLLNCISETLKREHISPEVQAQEDLENELVLVGITLPEKTIRSENEGQLDPASPEDHNKDADADIQQEGAHEETASLVPEMHTYYKDITTTLTTSDTKTMAEVLRAERMRMKNEETRKHLVIIHTIYTILTIIALTVGIYFIKRAHSPEFVPDTTPATAPLPSEIPVDTQFVWNIDSASLFDLRAKLDMWKAQPLELPGTVHQVLFTIGARILSLDQVFSAFERVLPSELNEAITSYTYGWYTSDTRYPFIILNINSFDLAFSGVRTWEKSLARDVGDIFFIERSEWFEDIETMSFEDLVQNNYKMRSLSAHRAEETRTTVTVDTLVTNVPQRHIVTNDILQAIQAITPEEIVFAKAHDAVRAFDIGDIIVGQATATTPGFVRKIVSFSLDSAGMLHVATTVARGTDILPDANGREIKQRVNAQGVLEYYISEQQEHVSRHAGEPAIVLFYTFISDTQLLIATDPQVLSVVIERGAEKVRATTEVAT